jgi:hypothetical protein
MIKQFLQKILCYRSILILAPFSADEVRYRARNIRNFGYRVILCHTEENRFSFLFFHHSKARYNHADAIAVKGIVEEEGDNETLLRVVLRPPLFGWVFCTFLPAAMALACAIGVMTFLITGVEQPHVTFHFAVLVLFQVGALVNYHIPVKKAEKALRSVFEE